VASYVFFLRKHPSAFASMSHRFPRPPFSLTHDLASSFALSGHPVYLAKSQSARFSLGIMHIRPGNPGDANAIASLIASFQPILTLEPSGAGAEQYLASVSEDAERQYLESPRYAYLVAELKGQMVGFVAMRDQTHLFHLFVAAAHQRIGIARALWEQARKLSVRAGPIAEFTVNSSLNAMPVYRSFGFVPAGAIMQAHGIAFLPMRLTLQNDV
jgi:GNAT superfamily N-acetyltransferase